VKVRVLCLHDESSSALSLIRQLQKVGKQLHHDHGIELAFVNSPHLTNINMSTNNNMNTNTNDNDNGSSSGSGSGSDENENANKSESDENENEMERQRVWYYNDNDNGKSKEDRLGLDASILHLRQIWSQSLYSNPFSGVLGIGQGASVAALLPFLRFDNPLPLHTRTSSAGDGDRDRDSGAAGDSDCAHDNDNENDDTKSDADDDDDADDCQMMFQGLQFCMFVNGWDLLNSNTNTSMNSSPQHDDDLEYKEATELPSLHIYHDNNNSNTSHQLYQRYGGGKVPNKKSKAQNLILKQPFKQLEKENGKGNENENAHASTTSRDVNAKAMNAIGKFLVLQKKNMISRLGHRHTLESNADQDIDIDADADANTNADVNANANAIRSKEIQTKGREIASMIESTQRQLANAEQRALELIHESVSENPPKALMAMILPTRTRGTDSSSVNVNQKGGTIVGGWMGERDAFRSEEFIRERGAPCPKEFTLSAEERGEKQDVDDDDDGGGGKN
jgi:hypothetical protein